MIEDEIDIARQRVGQVLGAKWKLEQLLGSGGMAAVYRATTPAGEVAAVKLLHPEMSLKRDVRERFLREAYAANRVAHPGAVAVLEHGGGGDEPAYLVMELLEGETLSTRFKRGRGLPLGELLDVLEQVLEVLVCAHERGIVHRDLKPDNLFLTTDGRVKVLDFGLARMAEGAPGDFRTQTGMALGTLPYMAPEQALGRSRDIDGRADLFSLGATAFRILAGRRIHESESEAELLMAMASQPAPRLSAVAPTVPADVCAVVDLALAFSRDARYPDARTMLGDVRALRAAERPPFVTGNPAVLGRDEPTRAERVAPVPAAPAPVQRPAAGGTMPLAVFAAPAPPSAPVAPPSARTELVAAVSPPPSPPPPASTPVVPIATGLPARHSRTQVVAALVALALVVLALGGAAFALFRVLGHRPGPSAPPPSAGMAAVAGEAVTASANPEPSIELAPGDSQVIRKAPGGPTGVPRRVRRTSGPVASTQPPAPTVGVSITGQPPSTSPPAAAQTAPEPPTNPPPTAKKQPKKGRGKGGKP